MSTKLQAQRVLAVLLGILSSFLLCPNPAACDEQRTVNMIPNDAYRPFFARLRAELQITGFRVEEASGLDNPDETEVQSMLQTACALLFVRESVGLVALYYRTRDNRTAFLAIPVPQNNEEEQVTAVHIGEVLRVAFVDTTLRAQSVPPAPPKTATKKTADALCGGLALNALFGHLGAPQAGISGALGVRLAPWLIAALNLDVPFWGMQFHEPEGDARIFMGGLGLRLGVVANTRIARPMVALGYQLWLIAAKAFPTSGYTGGTDTQLTSGPMLYAGGIFMITERMGVSLSGTAAVTTNEIEYAVTTRHVVTLGRPILGISLGIEWLPARRRR